ncbi:MAG: hypothetical protein V4700_01555 [Pseudomonadota bacterium]
MRRKQSDSAEKTMDEEPLINSEPESGVTNEGSNTDGKIEPSEFSLSQWCRRFFCIPTKPVEDESKVITYLSDPKNKS